MYYIVIIVFTLSSELDYNPYAFFFFLIIILWYFMNLSFVNGLFAYV